LAKPLLKRVEQIKEQRLSGKKVETNHDDVANREDQSRDFTVSNRDDFAIFRANDIENNHQNGSFLHKNKSVGLFKQGLQNDGTPISNENQDQNRVKFNQEPKDSQRNSRKVSNIETPDKVKKDFQLFQKKRNTLRMQTASPNQFHAHRDSIEKLMRSSLDPSNMTIMSRKSRYTRETVDVLIPIEEISEENPISNISNVNMSEDQEEDFMENRGLSPRLAGLSESERVLGLINRKRKEILPAINFNLNRDKDQISDSPHSHRIQRPSKFAPMLENSDPSNADKTEESNRDKKSDAAFVRTQCHLMDSDRSNQSSNQPKLIFDEIALEILEGRLIRFG